MKITIGSGKGGTGKTFVATNLAQVLKDDFDQEVNYFDCDVEAANAHLFLRDETTEEQEIMIDSVMGVDPDSCIHCEKCIEACQFNALTEVNDQMIFFKELCHNCGACAIVCPVDAIKEGKRKIGDLYRQEGEINLHYANLVCGESGMSPRLIQQVKAKAGAGLNIYDSPPGTACPVVETFRGSDLVVLVTDPTPFGLNDLKLAVKMSRKLGLEPFVLINRVSHKYDKLEEYCQKENLKVIGEIPAERDLAEIYSQGSLAVKENSMYRKIFIEIASSIIQQLEEGNPAKEEGGELTEAKNNHPQELVVISGKGGTGKTSISAALAALAEDIVVADCDVDAADLHLLLEPEIEEEGDFSGGYLAEIDQSRCVQCGECYQACRFAAISKEEANDEVFYQVDHLSCEGCGVCNLVCPEEAVSLHDAVNGKWYTSRIRFGQMAHAELGVAEENSGKLVTLVKDKAQELASRKNNPINIIDGSPGTGCPVTASLTGADYALVVTEPSVSGIHDLLRILELGEFLDIPMGIIVNKLDINEKLAGQIENTARQKGIDFLGSLPYDEDIVKAQIEGQTIIEYKPDALITEGLRKIWRKIQLNILKN
ncbi:MAG: 4Fe-4S binding protein [Bacillota bacterium]